MDVLYTGVRIVAMLAVLGVIAKTVDGIMELALSVVRLVINIR